ncbi:hypothetical protein WDV85_05490 [Pseudokineococcus sp. 5B2Z-1]|uniref:hypothetical protein n=1 Tax=Pseudokineococcus sp. 5B2Z-1 TaxID=3132744 RepID=UPI0030AAB458
MDVRRSEPGRGRGFAVPVVAGLALWLVTTSLLPVLVPFLQDQTGLYPPYVLTALWSAVQVALVALALVLVLLGVFRLLRALELHLAAGRPGVEARVGTPREDPSTGVRSGRD